MCVIKNIKPNIWCGSSKELPQWDSSFEHQIYILKLMGKKINNFRIKVFVYLHLWPKWNSTSNLTLSLQIASRKCCCCWWSLQIIWIQIRPVKMSGLILDPNCLPLSWYSWKSFSKKLILKKFSRRQKSMQNYPACKELTFYFTNSFKSCPAENTGPLALRIITLSESGIVNKSVCNCFNIAKDRAFLKNKTLDN